jgi:hypothetical protein
VQCDVCGNRYDNGFQLSFEGESYSFDCFECAIHALAPGCNHCGCRVIGHGTEVDDRIYCCGHCAREATTAEIRASARPAG